jgi:hypothetical protein
MPSGYHYCAGDLVYPGTVISHWLLIVYAALEMILGMISVGSSASSIPADSASRKKNRISE